MKLEELEAAEREKPRSEPSEKTGTLTVVRGEVKVVYLMDPVTKEVEARAFGPVGFRTREGVLHGMGAVRD